MSHCRYTMVLAQAVVFILMFGFSIFLLTQTSTSYQVPRNILTLTTVVSSNLVAGAVYGSILMVVLVKL